jgi:nucleoside-diphosphate kinase
MERTLLLVKPDGVQRKLVEEVISRFERKGWDLANEFAHNIVHGSNSPARAEREIQLFFNADELVN